MLPRNEITAFCFVGLLTLTTIHIWEYFDVVDVLYKSLLSQPLRAPSPKANGQFKAKKTKQCSEGYFQQSDDAEVPGGLAKIPASFLQDLTIRKESIECGASGLIYPWKASDRTWMTVIIKSSNRNRNYRDVVRQTWGSVTHVAEKTFRYIFVVGVRSDDSESPISLVKENLQFGDILQCDVEDIYQTLPQKVRIDLFHVIGKIRFEIFL